MKKTLIVLGVIALLGFIVVSWFWGSYNSLVAGNQQVDQSWAQVESQYQRRFDLIPNLVNATKGYMKQEQTVFKDIADARTHYAGASSPNDKVQASNQYESAIGRLLVVMENYPVLKSDAAVQRLTDELAGTENRINIARDRYNQQVSGWNTTIKSFPQNLLAGMFGFQPREFYKSQQGAENAPTVNLE